MVQYAAHAVAAPVGGSIANNTIGAVVLAGGSGKLSLAASAHGDSLFSGMQKALRYLQTRQHGSMQLTAVSGAALPFAQTAASRHHGSTVLAAGIQAIIKSAAAEAAGPTAVLPSSISSSYLEAAAAPVAATATDVFSAAHRQQGAWWLPHLKEDHQAPTAAHAMPQVLGQRLAGSSVTISGGMGSLGQLIAAWMTAADSSDRSTLALLGRSASTQLPETLVSGSCLVTAVQYDAASLADMAHTTFHHRSTSVYIHAGGVLRDAVLTKQTAASLRAVLAPKLSGNMNAVTALRHQPLQHHLLFSSAAALLGNAGQVNYAAANAALDASAQILQQQGAAATSLQWGPWAGGGMATASVAASLAAKGVGLVQPTSGLLLLNYIMAGGSSPTPTVLAPLVAIDWRRMLHPAQQRSAFFADVAPAVHTTSASGGLPQVAAARLPAAVAAVSLQQVQDQLLELVSGVIGGSIDPSAAFMSAGLDSLGAVELRNATSARFSVNLPATVTFDYPTPESLAAFVHSQLPIPVGSGAASSSGQGLGLESWTSEAPAGHRRHMRSRRQQRLAAGSSAANGNTHCKLQHEAAVLRQLSDVVVGVLGAPVPPEQPLMEAGLDSLGAVELRNAVASAFNLQLPATVTFDYPTLASLAAYVAGNTSTATDGDVADDGLLYDDSMTISPTDQPMVAAHGAEQSGSVTALVAVSCRYPAPNSSGDSYITADFAAAGLTAGAGNADLAGFHAAINAGASLASVVPPQRWDINSCFHPDGGTRRMYVRFGGWLAGLTQFDAAAFRLSASESVCLDPQARMLLEHTQELLAAPAATSAAGAVGTSIGVYVGCMYTEYLDGILGPAGTADSNSNAIVGHGLSFLVGRTSYTFGLQGPCISTDTACSSSLVALHMAHGGILADESAAGIAGGVNVMLIPQTTARICLLQALSPVGRCKTFDSSADGYGRSEAIALAMLQRADVAHSSGNAIGSSILGYVHASAVNQDGRSSSLTAPNGPAQTTLVRAALSAAIAAPQAVAFVSLHGTGTPLGDPIEVGALGSALSTGRASSIRQVVALGSSKSCYGHTEGTAGLTGSLLAATALQQHLLPPIVNLREINPYVSAALADWHSRHSIAASPSTQLGAAAQLISNSSAAKLAGTSSFGMSGVNAHALLSADGFEAAEELATTSNGVVSWQRAIYWPSPILHPLLLLAAARPAPAGVSRMVECAADFSAARLSWMRDHMVQGRQLLPAAAMFELAAAAVAACTTGDGSNRLMAALTELSIMAPCLLQAVAADSSNMLLRCSLDSKRGALELVSGKSTMHLQGAAAASCTPSTPEAGPARHPRSSGVAALLVGQTDPYAQGDNFARVGSSRQDTAGYHLHPGMFDACIHLAPVPLAGVPIQVTRVPVAAGAVMLPHSEGSQPDGWALAESVYINQANQSSSNNISWSSSSAGSSMHLVGLLARPLPVAKLGVTGAVAEAAAGSDLLYAVEWQAAVASCTTDATSFSSAAPAASWAVGGSYSRATIKQPDSTSDANYAAVNLQLMQQVVRSLPSQSSIHLQIASSPLPQPGAGGSNAVSFQQQQMLLGMIKVAALDIPDMQWSHSSAVLQQPTAHTAAAAAEVPVNDVFGPCLAGGAYLAPRLLATAPGAAAPTEDVVPGGAAVITGGLGALGTLIAAHHLSGGSLACGGQRHVVLLGRTIDLAALDAALGSTMRRTNILSRSALLTVAKCDSATAADMASLTHSMHASGIQINSIMHAAGVLQDALLTNQNAGSFRAAVAPKAAAARGLLKYTALASPVGNLQLFSSIASLLGSGGQSNYAAANAMLDALAVTWQQQGIRSASIAWGAWGGTGMAAGDSIVAARLLRVGISAIQPAAGLAALENAVTMSVAAGSGTIMAAGLVWDRLLVDGRQHKAFYAEFANVAAVAPRQQAATATDGLVLVAVGSSASKSDSLGLPEPLVDSSLPAWHFMSIAERSTFFLDQISALVARSAGKAVGVDEPLLSAGLDSLGAVEVRREVSTLTGLDLPATLIFDYPSVASMAGFVIGSLPPPTKHLAPVASSYAAADASASIRRSKAGRQRHPAETTTLAAIPVISAEQTLQLVTAQVREAVAKVLGGADVAASTPLMTAGLDSLGAVELRKELSSAFGIKVSATAIFDYPSVEALAAMVAEQVSSFSLARLNDNPDSGSDDDGSCTSFSNVDQAVAALQQRQLSVHRRTSDDEQRHPNMRLLAGSLPTINHNAPKLTRPTYFTVPSLKRLQRLTDAELRAVPRFVIGRDGVGEISFLYPVNLLGIDLDAVVSIERGRMSIYPHREAPVPSFSGGMDRQARSHHVGASIAQSQSADTSKRHVLAPPGDGLNQPALLTFRRMSVRNPNDRRTVQAFRGKLLQASARMNGVFVHYDPDEGVWLMKLDTWI